MYKTGIGFMTILFASAIEGSLLIPLGLFIIGALLIASGKEKE